MGKIVEVRIELDDSAPEFLMGLIRCQSVRSYDANGKLCIDHKDLVDNQDFHSEAAMIFALSKRLKLHSSIFNIIK